MSQDKHIKKHQETLEVLRENVRNRKQEFLKKIDIDDLMLNPKEYLTKLSQDFYNSEEGNIKKAIKGGKKLAKTIVKGFK